MSLGASSSLDASVLVLNKLYMAVHVISVRRAFCLLFKDLAEVVTIDDGYYQSYDFQSWREVSEARAVPRPGRRLHPHGPLRDRGAADHPASGL